MAGQPGRDPLIPDDLGVLVAAEAQGHDENPGGDELAGDRVGQLRPGAEVHLSGLTGLEMQPDGASGRAGFELAQKPPHGGVAAVIAVAAAQQPVDRRALEALLVPGLDPPAVGLEGGWGRGKLSSAEHLGQHPVVG